MNFLHMFISQIGPIVYIFAFYLASEIVFLLTYPSLLRRLRISLPDFKRRELEKRMRAWERIFSFLTYTAPLVGVLGTFLGLQLATSGLANITGAIMEKGLPNFIKGSTNAYMTTLIGLSISIINYFIDAFSGWEILSPDRQMRKVIKEIKEGLLTLKEIHSEIKNNRSLPQSPIGREDEKY